MVSRLAGWMIAGMAGLGLAARALAQDETWRFGIGVPTQNMVNGQTTTNLDDFPGYRPGDPGWNPLGISWYFNWNWTHGPVAGPAGTQPIEYMPLVGGWGPGVHPTIDQIRTRVTAYPTYYPDGTTWLIGNEILFDDNRTPQQYADDYHAYYYGLKSINPTYKVANGSVITSIWYSKPGFTGTPLQLLDAVRAAYQATYNEPMPVDVWNIHPYVWKKTTLAAELDDLRNQLSTFRDWMAAIGEQNKPLIITEYGLLDVHPEQWMIDYLRGSFDILLSAGHANGLASDGGRWVQRWAWFANNNHVWQAGGAVQWTHCALHNGDTFTIRPLGTAFAAYPKVDACPDDPAKRVPGVCGCGRPDIDSDADGVLDCLDACPATPPGSPLLPDGCPTPHSDFDRDGDVDQADFGELQRCMSPSGLPPSADCTHADLDGDTDVDAGDVRRFAQCLLGANVPADVACETSTP